MIGSDAVASRGNSATVFAVLAQRARTHSPRFLTAQAVASALGAALLLGFAWPWWPLAALCGAVGAYSAWGLADAVQRAGHPARMWRPLKPLKYALAALAVACSLLAVGGAAAAAFTGDAPGPYGTCYAPNGRAYACDAGGRRR